MIYSGRRDFQLISASQNIFLNSEKTYFSFFKNYCDEEVRQASTESWNWQKETGKKIIREEEEENEYINK